MKPIEGASFKLYGETVIPVAADDGTVGYVLPARPEDVVAWQDIEAVAKFACDTRKGLVPPELQE